MSPISIKRSLALVALVAVASISASSAFFGRREPDDWEFPPLPDRSDWTPQQLMVDFSKGYQPRWAEYYQREYGEGDEISGTAYSWLSRTGDKNVPNTIFNKYSVQDLLDLNLVYYKKATLEEYVRRKQICKDFDHEEISEREWRLESRFTESAEAKLLNQKYYLRNYCWATLGRFRPAVFDYVDKQVRRTLAKKDNENLKKFRKSFFDYYKARVLGDDNQPEFDVILEEHVRGYDKETFAELMASCSKLEELAETYLFEELDLSSSARSFRLCQKMKTM